MRRSSASAATSSPSSSPATKAPRPTRSSGCVERSPSSGAWRPDVLVLDVGLPDRDGLELCRRLRESPDSATLPVVLLTGLAELTETEAEAAGANALPRKPFGPLELLSTIERLAGGLPE